MGQSPGAPAAFKHLLEQRVPTLNPKGRAPTTAAKLEMRDASLSEIEAVIKEWAESGTGPFNHDLFRFQDIKDQLPRVSLRNPNASISRALDAVGAEKHTRNTNPKENLPKLQLWSFRNHDEWQKAGPTGRCKAYLEMRGISAEDFHLLS